jgi:hypothetical protein
MIDNLPINNDEPIHVFVLVIRLTKTGLLSSSRPCGKSSCGNLTGCKKALAVDAKKKGYIVDFVIYSDIDADTMTRHLVKESIHDLITKHPDYETKGQLRCTGDDCRIS